MRKLIREMLTSRKLLCIDNRNFIPSLVDVVMGIYSGEYAEMAGYRQKVLEYICHESDSFDQTIERGVRRLEKWLEEKAEKRISGKEILLLEKEYGVPVPLIENESERLRIEFDIQEYLSAHRKWEARLVQSN